MSSWILLVLVVAVALWVIGAYNGLVSLKNQTLNAFKQIDVQLKRRHDLIPNLVNADAARWISRKTPWKPSFRRATRPSR